MDADQKTWLIVGSGLSAPEYFDALVDRLCPVVGPSATTITCNAGIHLFWTREGAPLPPTYYWLSDAKACELFGRYARVAQAEGTKIVTARRNESGLDIRGLGNADMLVDLPERGPGFLPFTPGSYVHARFSGLIITQFALNMGATRVVWCGFDGYRSSPGAGIVQETFDGRTGKPKGHEHTQTWLGPFMQSVIYGCPHATFFFFGKPRYRLTGRNLTVIRAPRDMDQPTFRRVFER